MNVRRSLAIGAAALSLSACQREEELTGQYKLIGSISGPLPIVLERNNKCETNLEDGSVAFSGEKRYDSKYRIVLRCPLKPDSILPDPGARGGSYELVGDTVRFFNEMEAPVGLAFRAADTLKITGPNHTLIYLKEK